MRIQALALPDNSKNLVRETIHSKSAASEVQDGPLLLDSSAKGSGDKILTPLSYGAHIYNTCAFQNAEVFGSVVLSGAKAF
jgi:hypothetical protein